MTSTLLRSSILTFLAGVGCVVFPQGRAGVYVTAALENECAQLGRAKDWTAWDDLLGCNMLRPLDVCASPGVFGGRLAEGSTDTQILTITMGWVGTDQNGRNVASVSVLRLPLIAECEQDFTDRSGDAREKCYNEHFSSLYMTGSRCCVVADSESGKGIESQLVTDAEQTSCSLKGSYEHPDADCPGARDPPPPIGQCPNMN